MRFLPACCRGISYGPYLSELSPIARLFENIGLRPHVPPIPTSIKTTSHCSFFKNTKCRRRFHFKGVGCGVILSGNFTDTAYIISISVLNHIFCIYTKLSKIIKTDGETYRPTSLAGLNQNLFGKSTYTSFTVSAGGCE